MSLPDYHAYYVKLLNYITEEIIGSTSELYIRREELSKHKSSSHVLEFDESDHEVIHKRKAKPLHFTWRFWKMWKFTKFARKQNCTEEEDEVPIAILLPKRSQVSVVRECPCKTKRCHHFQTSPKGHFDWRFWKRKSNRENSVRCCSIVGRCNEDRQARRMLIKELVERHLNALGSGDRSEKEVENKNKFSSKKFEGSKASFHECASESCRRVGKLRSAGKSQESYEVIVASAHDLRDSDESEVWGFYDTDDISTEYYGDIIIGRTATRKLSGGTDKRKEWLTRDDTLIKEADIKDPNILKRDIVPRKKRRSKFASFDMKTKIRSDPPSPQSGYKRKVVRKKPRPRVRIRTPSPEPEPEQEPEYAARPPVKDEPKPREEKKPQEEKKEEPKPAPCCPPDTLKLKIPVQLASTRVLIRVPKNLFTESIKHQNQDCTPCRSGVKPRHCHALSSYHIIEESKGSCLFRKAFGCFSRSDMADSYDDIDESDSYEEDDEDPSTKRAMCPLCWWRTEKKYKTEEQQVEKPCGTSLYKKIRTAKANGICCCGPRRRNVPADLKCLAIGRIMEDSTAEMGGCCPCKCVPFKRKRRCQCTNPNCGDNLQEKSDEKSKSKNKANKKKFCPLMKLCQPRARKIPGCKVKQGSFRPKIRGKKQSRDQNSFAGSSSSSGSWTYESYSTDETASSKSLFSRSSKGSKKSPKKRNSKRKSGEDLRRPKTNFSVDVIPLHNEWAQTSFTRLKNFNRFLAF